MVQFCRSLGRRVVCGLIITLALLPLQACTSIEELESLQHQLEATRGELKEDQRQFEIRLADLAPDSPLGPEARSALAAAAAKAQAADALAEEMRAIVQRAKAPEADPATAPFGTLGTLLPPPLRVPLALGGALLVTLGRAAQLKKGLRSVAQSIEAAKKTDEQFKVAFARHSPTFRAVQTPIAQKVVAQVSTENPRWCFPI
jgi:hypothetical protein